MTSLTYISWFAGIGGFDLALDRAGWRRVGACEIDPFARAVFKGRLGEPDFFPEDITHVKPEEIPKADLWCGGFPCQGISPAGLRRGWQDERSVLVFDLLRLAAKRSPTWILLENIDALLTMDRGITFNTLLAALDEIGYVGAWRVLDARGFDVPQRRHRVFILARLAGAPKPCPGAVLFDAQSRRRDSASGGTPWPHATGALGGSSPRAGWRLGPDEAAAGQLVVPDSHVPAVTAKWAKGTGGPRSGDKRQSLVAYNIIGLAQGSKRHAYKTGHSVALQGKGAKPTGNEAGTVVAGFNTFAESGRGGNGYTEKTSPPVRDRNPPDLSTAGGLRSRTGGEVRRLTPLECERLMSLPDGWTCLCSAAPCSTAKCKCPNGPRYRALGNAVVVKVVEWIAHRLRAAIESAP